jgi:hypothetical protein
MAELFHTKNEAEPDRLPKERNADGVMQKTLFISRRSAAKASNARR